jgi:hypothetical protein
MKTFIKDTAKKFGKGEMEAFIKNAAKKTNSTKKNFVSWCKLVAFHQAGLKDRWKREYEKDLWKVKKRNND